ncbi:MAG: outer membrane beta-barrel protein [Prevotella sp.]|nr:outer membrane beta-barrel protein [Prevotella sp.]
MIQRILVALILLASIMTHLYGQSPYRIKGRTINSETREVMDKVVVTLYHADSTYVGSMLTDSLGTYVLPASKGKYIVKISSLGFDELWKNVNIIDKNVDLGDAFLKENAIMLQETTVSANLPKVILREDTIIYNADAYRVPEGSTIDALVERLPGAEIDDDGNITINGKQVKKILVDGREFMVGDTKIAMKNLPSAIVDKVKAYDQKSEMSRLTGIDDGNETTILDFNIKPKMKKGFFANADVGYGTRDRYSSRLMGARMYGDLRYTLIGNANNNGDEGMGGRRGRQGGGGNGLRASKTGAVNVNYEKRDKLRVDGSVRWTHGSNETATKRSAESFVNTKGAFSNNIAANRSRNDNWNGNARVEWRLDSLTNINIRPTFNYSINDNRSANTSVSFRQDPYLYVTDPLSLEALALLDADSLVVNGRTNKSMGYSENKSLGLSFQLYRRLSRTGRNFTIGGNINWGNNENRNLSASNIHLYQVQNQWGLDSTYQTNRYNLTPGNRWSYSLQATYSEPLFKNVFLQLNYSFNYSHNRSNRSTYDFDDMTEEVFYRILNQYRDYEGYFSYLPQPLEGYLDAELSRLSSYDNYNHDINVQLRVVREKYNMNVGVQVRPQSSHFIQNYYGLDVDTVRHVTNLSPTLNFRYRFNRQRNLQLTYHGTTTQPNITDMLDIYDDSNPLNITVGNPGLKPSFTSNISGRYNDYRQRHNRTLNANMDFSTTNNSISRRVTYDEATGGRTTRPENINGNWNIRGNVTYNLSLDTMNVWNVNTNTRMGYNHMVSYLAVDRSSSSEKNVTTTTTWGQRLSASYRNKWLEIELNGSLNYSHSKNALLPKNNMDTWRFNYGADIHMRLPWGTSISTDIHENSRRGFNQASMNTNELIWTAQISQGFLRGKPLTVMLQLYDILGQQSTFSRIVNDNGRSDTEYNSITSYCMLHVQYRLNIFGNREMRRSMRGMEGFDDNFGGGRGGNRGRRGGGSFGDYGGGNRRGGGR